MDRSPTFLVVVNRCASDPTVLTKALRLARQFGARLELFLCDAEHAYALQHAYDRTGLEDARKACIVAAMEYLTRVKSAAQCDGVAISVDVTCESPLYEGIVHKARKSGPVLVLKHAGSPDPFDRAAFEPTTGNSCGRVQQRCCSRGGGDGGPGRVSPRRSTRLSRRRRASLGRS